MWLPSNIGTINPFVQIFYLLIALD
jgi:hypothetical protein